MAIDLHGWIQYILYHMHTFIRPHNVAVIYLVVLHMCVACMSSTSTLDANGAIERTTCCTYSGFLDEVTRVLHILPVVDEPAFVTVCSGNQLHRK